MNELHDQLDSGILTLRLGAAALDRYDHGCPRDWSAPGTMREGDLLVAAFTGGQIGYHRPFPGAGTYRAHIPGLYLCGSSSHPGGNITGLPGYNAAQVILADLGVAADWMPQPIATRLASL